MQQRPEPPTVCVVNAVDTLRAIAGRAPAGAETIAECFPQQDQAIFWQPAEKLIVTAAPIAELDWQTGFLGLPGIVNAVPAKSSGPLFTDILDDRDLMARLVEHAGPARRFRLVPHTTTPELWTFAETMRSAHGVTVELPESCERQELRDLLDTKSGLRDLVADLGLTGGRCRTAPGRHCTGLVEARNAVLALLGRGRPCIVKADKGEASVGLLVFRPGDREDHIARELASSSYYGDDPIVVEEYIDGAGVVFPSVEYVVPADPGRAPYLTHACEMLFEAPTLLRGNVTAPSFIGEKWYEPFRAGSRVIADELQRRGYQGHFGIDAVAAADGEVIMLDLNARRTGSTHVHDFGLRFFGTGYQRHQAVGNHDFYGLPAGTPFAEVLDLLGPLVRRPEAGASGVVPCELTGLATGRLSCMIYAPTLTGFHELVRNVRDRIERG
ncbi:hypothetical protein [Kitasatospora sp. NPDC093806]|uniref:hypothetical protein n=1 Tax=Kitasatospora sp. NPDC093806 TaxID=3155075 RepID=UPI00343F829C